jgi:hypothetical protein
VYRFAILSFVFLAARPLTGAAQQAPAAHDSLKGAIRVVDVSGRALEVTTGVGMALRVVRLQVSGATRVTAAGADLPLAQLQPGDVVRVSYGGQPGGYIAYAIERVGRMATGPERTP